MHLCTSPTTLGVDLSLPCRLTAHLADKAYASAGEAASALHSMAVLQVFQAKLLQSLDSGNVDADAMKDLRTDFVLMATKRSAQAIGRSMRFMMFLHRHLWLTLAALKDLDRKALLNAPITPSSLFSDVQTVEFPLFIGTPLRPGPSAGFEGSLSTPFEHLDSIALRELSLKTALLLALASAKRIGDLQALGECRLFCTR